MFSLTFNLTCNQRKVNKEQDFILQPSGKSKTLLAKSGEKTHSCCGKAVSLLGRTDCSGSTDQAPLNILEPRSPWLLFPQRVSYLHSRPHASTPAQHSVQYPVRPQQTHQSRSTQTMYSHSQGPRDAKKTSRFCLQFPKGKQKTKPRCTKGGS